MPNMLKNCVPDGKNGKLESFLLYRDLIYALNNLVHYFKGHRW